MIAGSSPVKRAKFMKNFELPNYAFCSVTTHKEWSSLSRKKEPLTDDELVKMLKREDIMSVTSSEDHPEFAALRNLLEKEGFIETQRNYWNGDTVLQSFTLNGKLFLKGHRFLCGAAMQHEMERLCQKPI